ncbi:MAG: FAD-dependent oxidoreductase [Deinococcota bacterium]
MAKPAILAVDDEAEVLRALARDLRKTYGKDYRILRAEGGEAALEAVLELQERAEPLALVISDQRMPVLSGVQLLERVAEAFPAAKRVLLTAYADTDAAITAINQSKVHYYLLKPWDDASLYPVVGDLLDDWQSGYRPGYEGLHVIGSRWSADAHAIKDFLARNQVPYTFADVETDDDAKAAAARYDSLPLVHVPGEDMLVAPSVSDVASKVGLHSQAARPFYDLAIVGAGPAGLAAAVYGASEGLETVLIEGQAPGGQAGTSSRIENYLGFPTGLSGGDLARRAVTQARRFGVEILTPQQVTRMRVEGPYRILELTDGSEVSSHTVMLSMGVAWRTLPADPEGKFTGAGVYYGAATTEAINCRGQTIYTVGAGNSAGQAAIYFANYAAKVVMLVRGSSLAAKMSHYLVDRIEQTDNIEVMVHHEITACHGDTSLEQLTLRNNETGDEHNVDAQYLFCFIGAAPKTSWLEGTAARDKRGFIYTGVDIPEISMATWPLPRNPFPLETSVPGVFAAGDVRANSIKRVASAVGEGSVAVSTMHQHLASL